MGAATLECRRPRLMTTQSRLRPRQKRAACAGQPLTRAGVGSTARMKGPAEIERLQASIRASAASSRAAAACSPNRPRSRPRTSAGGGRAPCRVRYRRGGRRGHLHAHRQPPRDGPGHCGGIDAFLERVGSLRNRLLFCCGWLSVARWDVPRARAALEGRHGRGCTSITSRRLERTQGNARRCRRSGRSGRVARFAGSAMRARSFGTHPAFAGRCGKDVSDGWAVVYLRALVM